MNQLWQQAKELVTEAEHIVILQAENPDGDSLGSALALDEIFAAMGKQTTLYSHMPVPQYLRYLKGWDRVEDELPNRFDLTVVVDASVQSLFDKTFAGHQASAFNRSPVIIFDHHGNFSQGDHLDQRFANVLTVNDPSYVATAELLYEWVLGAELPLPLEAADNLTAAILSDSLGLMSEGTSPRTVRIVSELMEKGVSLSGLDQRRRELMKKSPEIAAYKGKLLQRIEYQLEGQLAIVHIPWQEIAQYSSQYNPSMLVLDEMRLIQGVRVAIALKTYPDGKMTAKIRTNPDGAIADKIAEHFGAGGHSYAAGFKVHTDSPNEIKTEMIHTAELALREFDATRTTTEPC